MIEPSLDADQSDNEVVVLYRPVGQKELDLIAESNWRSFPPRLSWQPLFYPVLNETYATQIAATWNTKDEANGAVGYVTRFSVRASFLAAHEVHQVGGDEHLEYWIPASELSAFNDSIVGEITVISGWRGQPPERIV